MFKYFVTTLLLARLGAWGYLEPKIDLDCAEANFHGMKYNGVRQIQLNDFAPKPIHVRCDQTTNGGGWTVIQRRKDGSIDFDRNWSDYSQGFGQVDDGEFFIGLENLHKITSLLQQELLIQFEDSDGKYYAHAHYDAFAINTYNALQVVGNYTGTAGDLLTHGEFNVGLPGGWWHDRNGHKTTDNHPNGVYSNKNETTRMGWGEIYTTSIQMMVRPKNARNVLNLN